MLVIGIIAFIVVLIWAISATLVCIALTPDPEEEKRWRVIVRKSRNTEEGKKGKIVVGLAPSQNDNLIDSAWLTPSDENFGDQLRAEVRVRESAANEINAVQQELGLPPT